MKIASTDEIRHVRAFSGELAQEFERRELVGIHFLIDEDLSWYSGSDVDYKRLRDYIRDHSLPHLTKNPTRQAGVRAGVVHAFLHDFQVGDVIMTPLGDGGWLVGRIRTGYRYVPTTAHVTWEAGGREIPAVPPHQRGVRWLGVLSAHQVPQQARFMNWAAAYTFRRHRQPEAHAALVEALRRHVSEKGAGSTATLNPSRASSMEAVRAELLKDVGSLRDLVDDLQRKIEKLGGA